MPRNNDIIWRIINMSDEYKIISEFCCWGEEMVTIKIDSRAVCVMPKWEFNRIIETKRFEKRNKLKRSA